MLRPWGDDVKSDSRKFNLAVQNNKPPSLNVYRDSVMMQNEYTMMTEYFYEDDRGVNEMDFTLYFNILPYFCIPSPSTFQMYYLLHAVLGAGVQNKERGM